MKPYCDRPLCTRQFSHQHPQGPETAPGASESDAEPVPSPDTPGNGSGPEIVSAQEVGKGLVERARAMRTTRGRPAVEEPWAAQWERVRSEIEAAERHVAELRAGRLALLAKMKEDLSLAEIAEVTGLTRQRVGQLLGRA